MNDARQVAQAVADLAPKLVEALIADPILPEIQTREQAEFAIETAVTQDKWYVSWRVWSAIFAGATAVLSVPEVQGLLGSYLPVATLFMSAGSALISKYLDPRPTR
jgi:hypothetical protein